MLQAEEEVERLELSKVMAVHEAKARHDQALAKELLDIEVKNVKEKAQIKKDAA